MRTASRLALAITVLCAPALADGVWKFTEGSTYTWDGTTEFHYTQSESPSSSGEGGFSTGSPTTIGDPQWECVTLKATVLSVDPDGAGHLGFSVEAVRIETRFDSGGEHAEWDSSKSAETDVEGYKRYQAIVGNRFKAVIGPDGGLRSVEGAEWTRPEPATQAVGKKTPSRIARVEKAARETHDPTPPGVWLSLLFGTTPERRADWTRALLLPQEEKLRYRADGDETIGSYRCTRTKLESVDKKRLVKAEDVKVRQGTGDGAVGEFAMALCDAARKKGTIWFSRKIGCLVKVDIEAATEHNDLGRLTETHFKWGIELKDRGTAPAAPVDPGTTPTK